VIRWSPRAVADLEYICERISRDSDAYACLFAKRVMTLVSSLPEFPFLGRMVPEYKDDNIREKIYQDYRIVYRLRGKDVEIAAICHGSRLLKSAYERP